MYGGITNALMNVLLVWGVGVLALSLALMIFVSLAEVSLATLSRAHVRKLVEAGVSSAATVENLLRHTERFLSAVLILRTVAIAAAAGAAVELALAADVSVALAVVILALILVVVQVGARVVAVHHPMGVALRLARPLHWLTFLTTPITWTLLRILDRAGVRDGNMARNIFLSEDGLRLLLNFGEEERFIEAEEREMIDSIFRFSETTVGEVMVPRVDCGGPAPGHFPARYTRCHCASWPFPHPSL